MRPQDFIDIKNIPEVDLESVSWLLLGLDADLALDEPCEEGAVGAAQQRHGTHVARPEQERRTGVAVMKRVRD